MSETPLDQAHRAMTQAPQDDQSRLSFFGHLASAELFLFLEQEVSGDKILPRLFNTEDGDFVLAFDREDRLAEFAGEAVPYAALSGRALANLLDEPKTGILLNPGFASSEALPQETLQWMRETLSAAPERTQAQFKGLHAPNASESFLKTIDRALASATGLADHAFLSGTLDEAGGSSLVLAFVNAKSEAEIPLATAIQEAVVFSGDEGTVDVVFLPTNAPILEQFEERGLRFDLPQTELPRPPSAPGLNPKKPPKLR